MTRIEQEKRFAEIRAKIAAGKMHPHVTEHTVLGLILDVENGNKTIDTLTAQLAATEAKLREAEGRVPFSEAVVLAYKEFVEVRKRLCQEPIFSGQIRIADDHNRASHALADSVVEMLDKMNPHPTNAE